MGTIFNVVAYGDSTTRLDSAIGAALEEADRLDRMLSNYRPESELSRVNRYAAHRPVGVSDEFYGFLTDCANCSRLSEGAFDLTVGPLMKISGFYGGTGHLPRRDQLAAALEKVGYENVILDDKQKTVKFARNGVELDPGGAGKGFTVDKMIQVLEQACVQAALISAGGSAIYALGAPPGEEGWEVSIKNPRLPSKLVETVRLRDESISTSGVYEKSFWADGKIWGHIMDPRSGYPALGTLSVSVIAPRAFDSEVWTKPFYILGRSWTEKHKSRGFRVLYCEDSENTPCVWLV